MFLNSTFDVLWMCFHSAVDLNEHNIAVKWGWSNSFQLPIFLTSGVQRGMTRKTRTGGAGTRALTNKHPAMRSEVVHSA